MAFEMRMLKLGSVSAGLLLLMLAEAAAAPRVVASIMPVHGLVAAVMQGVEVPNLLLPGGRSPHDYAMRPSKARQLQQADLVIWIGPQLETFLAKPVTALGDPGGVVTLFEAPGVDLLPTRAGGMWAPDDHDHDHDHDHGHKDDAGGAGAGTDPHIWLDPDNAIAMARHVATRLGQVDPTNAATYAENAARLADRLTAASAEIATLLQPVRQQRYVVFHDAYQYFEAHFRTAAAGSVAVSPDRKTGARRLHEIRARIVDQDVVCLFREPQFEPAIVRTIADGTPVRVGVLDPLGADIPPGPEAYEQLLRALARSLADCLAG